MTFNSANINYLSLFGLVSLLIVALYSLNFTMLNMGSPFSYILLSSSLLLFIVSFSIPSYYAGNKIYNINRDNLSFYFLIYWFIATISTLTSYSSRTLLANEELVLHMSYLIIYILSSNLLLKHPAVSKQILITLSFLSIPLTIQYWYIKINGVLQYEGSGLLISSNLLAIYLVISIFILFQFCLKKKLLVLVLFGIYGLTIIDTGSRSALLSLVIAGIVTFSFKYSKNFKIKHFMICVTMVILLASLLYMVRPESVKRRLLLWELGFSVVDLRHIILGNGIGYLSEQLGEIQSGFYSNRSLSDQLLAGEVKTVLNEYLRMLIEIGAIGLISFVIGLYLSIKILKDSKMFYLVGALVAMIFFSLSSYPLASAPVCILVIVIITFSLSLLPNGNTQISNLQFTEKTKKHKILSIILILPLGLLLYETTSYGLSIIKWNNLNKTLSVYYNEARFHNMYANLYKTLLHEPMFLIDYGEKLQSLRYYKEADQLLKRASEIQPSPSSLILLGYNYQQLKKYDLAESAYKKASSILPKSFFPRYMLFELYRSLGNKDLAKSTATEIVLHPIKIPSRDVMEIKKEVIKYLNNNFYEES